MAMVCTKLLIHIKNDVFGAKGETKYTKYPESKIVELIRQIKYMAPLFKSIIIRFCLLAQMRHNFFIRDSSRTARFSQVARTVRR